MQQRSITRTAVRSHFISLLGHSIDTTSSRCMSISIIAYSTSSLHIVHSVHRMLLTLLLLQLRLLMSLVRLSCCHLCLSLLRLSMLLHPWRIVRSSMCRMSIMMWVNSRSMWHVRILRWMMGIWMIMAVGCCCCCCCVWMWSRTSVDCSMSSGCSLVLVLIVRFLTGLLGCHSSSGTASTHQHTVIVIAILATVTPSFLILLLLDPNSLIHHTFLFRSGFCGRLHGEGGGAACLDFWGCRVRYWIGLGCSSRLGYSRLGYSGRGCGRGRG
mmetsp:Transcript_23430/g.50751  ORF Transcript_23430/g.50751 Transcript_23430/m.50751 type:complete len:270 (-) Transcript_23430:1098-1907(-)